MNAADSRAHAREETPKNPHVFLQSRVDATVLYRSVELNIPEDNQCLRFILYTVKTFGNVEVLRENHLVGCRSWGNRFCTTSELVVGAKASTSYKLCMLFLLYRL